MTEKPDDPNEDDSPSDRDDDKSPLLRRSFLTGAAATATAGALAAMAGQSEKPNSSVVSGADEQQFDLKMVTAWPKNFPGLGTAAERLVKRIQIATGGAIRIRVYAAGELVPALGVFDAVQRGLADMYHGAEYYWQGKSSAFNFFAAVPFGFNAAEMSAWIRYGGGQQLWDELSAGFGIKPMMAANSGMQMGGWYKQPINSLEDLKGLKIRMPGLGGEVLNRLGAATITLPGAEIFQALQSGAIDGTEWVGPWNDLALGFYKVAKNYYYPGFHEPGTVLSLGINLDVWNRFNDAQRQIISSAAAAEVETSLAEFNAENARSLEEILAMPDITLAPFPDEVSRAIARVSAVVLAEIAQGDDINKRIHKSFTEFRRRAIAYNKVSEFAFARARALEDK